MADFTDSKSGPNLNPLNVVESGLRRAEPLITPEQLKSRHLFGVPLVSNIKNPLTNKPDVMTDDLLKDVIDRAIAMVETDTSLDIFPNRVQEKLEFDSFSFNSWGYMQTNRKPVASIEALQITLANGSTIYTVSQEWIETAQLHKGQINIIPMGTAISAGGVTQSGTIGNAAFMNILGTHSKVPSFWNVTYTTGFPDGMIPKIINELIGVYAAVEVLGMLAATNAGANSKSLGVDGLSQSVSGPGQDKYTTRINQLEEKKKNLLQKLKTIYGQTLISSHV